MAAEEDDKRSRVKLEILTTERSYVNDLTTMVEVFMRPLQQNADGPNPIISRNEVSTLFSNLENILVFNQQLLIALEEESANGSSSIGQIFIDLSPYLKMYCIYVNGHNGATELHQTLLERNQKKEGLSPYAQFLQDCGEKAPERVRNRQLTDMLIMPVQRVPRYRLLLEELLKRTQPGEEYDTLEMGLAKIAGVANLVNERLREFENRMRVLKIQKRFGNAVALVQPHRRFVMEGTLQKMCRKGPKDYVFVLFSDLLVYGTPSITNTLMGITDDQYEDQSVVFKREIPLNTCSLSSLPNFSFQISSPTKSFVVIAPDQAVRDSWYAAIETCVASCTARAAEVAQESLSAASSHGASTSNGDADDEPSVSSSTHAPVWVPDKDAPNCQLPECNVKFTLLNRRHHCRSCGLVVCAECSPHRWHLPNIDKSKPQRICNNCYMEIRQKLEDDNFESAGSANTPRPAAPASNSSSGGGSKIGFFPLSKASGLLSRFASSLGPTSPTKQSNERASSSSSSVARAADSGADSNDLPRNWRQLKDESGKTYYWHVLTDMVTYDRPTGKVLPVDSKQNAASKPVTFSTPPQPSTQPKPVAVAQPVKSEERPSSMNRTSSSKALVPTLSTAALPRPKPVQVPTSAAETGSLIPPGSPMHLPSSGRQPSQKQVRSIVPRRKQ